MLQKSENWKKRLGTKMSEEFSTNKNITTLIMNGHYWFMLINFQTAHYIFFSIMKKYSY